MTTAIYLELGKKKVFACSLEWPGWCRSGKTEDQAVEALQNSAHRYAIIAQKAGLDFHPDQLTVVERVQGDATTDFGAPSIVTAADRLPLDAATAERNVALLRAAWALLDEVLASSPNELRKGPRGGGRDRDEVARHVIEAERSYARTFGVRFKPFSPTDRQTLTAFRAEVAATLSKPSPAVPPGSRGWPPAYAVRRMAWHVVDHIWEIEDRRP